jgi:hypothetical protein
MISNLFFTPVSVSLVGFIAVVYCVLVLYRKKKKLNDSELIYDVVEGLIKDFVKLLFANWIFFFIQRVGDIASVPIWLFGIFLGAYWVVLVTKDFIVTIHYIVRERY